MLRETNVAETLVSAPERAPALGISMSLDPTVESRLQAILAPKRSRILMAEDDPIGATVLQVALSKLGYEPVIARDGAEAWDKFNLEPVRLIVSDWMMPGLDGLALCEKVRARPQTPYTYFILLTANHTSADNYEMATAAGVDDFLTKPLDREAIRMRLRVAERILKYTAEIRHLKELIPVCIYCHKVRDDHDHWDLIESYLQKQTGSRFSHGACPECCAREMANFTGEFPPEPGGHLDDGR